MDSPTFNSTWSEAFMLSDDSGLLTNSSISSGSISARAPIEFQDSDKSFSPDDSFEELSGMCNEQFGTMKKVLPIVEPPLEFQDRCIPVNSFAEKLSAQIISIVLNGFDKKLRKLRSSYYSDFYSPCHNAKRPNSRNSLGSSRLSSSHNSLTAKLDDSNFITQAVSHDILCHRISDLYNVPFDSDLYAVPVDNVRFNAKRIYEKPIKNTTLPHKESPRENRALIKRADRTSEAYLLSRKSKRHSVAGNSSPVENEPIHMTLEEVRRYLRNLHSDPSAERLNNNNNYSGIESKKEEARKKGKCDKKKNLPNKLSSVKQTLRNIFKLKRCSTSDKKCSKCDKAKVNSNSVISRALPPLPSVRSDKNVKESPLDFASSIQRVKDYGWYWGPLSSEAAEKVLSNEPDGSFIVRDSSDDHYIFSLTFKLNDYVRHVRIEHDQGNFSFGSCTKFKSQTIIDFIENAVEHSRSGRYLFFLHRRPLIGPVRVQLLHPVSRFKQIQSLQHICRFVIHKTVRRDLIGQLPLPRRMIDYLNTANYYSEHFIDDLIIEQPDRVETTDGDHLTSLDYIVIDGVTNF